MPAKLSVNPSLSVPVTFNVTKSIDAVIVARRFDREGAEASRHDLPRFKAYSGFRRLMRTRLPSGAVASASCSTGVATTERETRPLPASPALSARNRHDLPGIKSTVAAVVALVAITRAT